MAVKDISTGSISAEIKNTSYLQLLKDKLGRIKTN